MGLPPLGVSQSNPDITEADRDQEHTDSESQVNYSNIRARKRCMLACGVPIQRDKWMNLLPFLQLVREGFSDAAAD